MSPRAVRLTTAAGANAALFALAFVLAPHSCDGGFDVYFWSGVGSLAAMLALPFVVRTGGSLLACLGWGVALVLLCATVWLVGLFAANVRIICHLF